MISNARFVPTQKMDPTEALCRHVHSFNKLAEWKIYPQEYVGRLDPYLKRLKEQGKTELEPLEAILKFEQKDRRKVEGKPEVAPLTNAQGSEVVHCDRSRYDILVKLKSAFPRDDTDVDRMRRFMAARANANPFESVGRSIFMNRSAMKLANIDAYFQLTGDMTNKQLGLPSSNMFSYCDLAGGPGGFVQYLQLRSTECVGFGITLSTRPKTVPKANQVPGDYDMGGEEKDGSKHPVPSFGTGLGLDWRTDLLNMDKFHPFTGGDGTGNLFTNWEPFVEHVRRHYTHGVDLATSDGGIDASGADSTRESLTTPLIASEVLVALSVLKKGGKMVLKTHALVTTASGHLVYIISQCFREICIFKPVSSRPNGQERYIIGIDFIDDDICKHYIKALADLIQLYRSQTDVEVKSILTEIPENDAAIQYLTDSNNLSTERRLKAVGDILKLMANPNASLDIPEYDLHLCYILWDVPTGDFGKKSLFFRGK